MLGALVNSMRALYFSCSSSSVRARSSLRLSPRMRRPLRSISTRFLSPGSTSLLGERDLQALYPLPGYGPRRREAVLLSHKHQIFLVSAPQRVAVVMVTTRFANAHLHGGSDLA